MGFFEGLFLASMGFQQLVYLFNRRRRPLVLSYTPFITGICAVLWLFFEPWRWVFIPLLALWLLQSLYLLATLGSLKDGFTFQNRLIFQLGRGIRTILVFFSLLLTLGVLILGILFPGGDQKPRGLWPVAWETLKSKKSGNLGMVLYPTGNPTPQRSLPPEYLQFLQTQAQVYEAPPGLWAYQAALDRGLSWSTGLPAGEGRWPTVVWVPGPRESLWNWLGPLVELASRGFVILVPWSVPQMWDQGAPGASGPLGPLQNPTLWREAYKSGSSPREIIRQALELWEGLSQAPDFNKRLEGQPLLLSAGWALADLQTLPENLKTPWKAWASWGNPKDTTAWNPGISGLQVPRDPPAENPSIPGTYTLILPSARLADLDNDGALAPYLYFLGLRSRPDDRSSYLMVRVTALFFEWKSQRGDGSLFLYGKPAIQDVLLQNPSN